jgi:hypothetical protein
VSVCPESWNNACPELVSGFSAASTDVHGIPKADPTKIASRSVPTGSHRRINDLTTCLRLPQLTFTGYHGHYNRHSKALDDKGD